MNKLLTAIVATVSITACKDVVYVDGNTGKKVFTAETVILEEFDEIYCNGGIVYGMELAYSGVLVMPIIKSTHGDPAVPEYLTCNPETGKIYD